MNPMGIIFVKSLMPIYLCLNGNWSDYGVLCDDGERTAVQELLLAYLNTLYM